MPEWTPDERLRFDLAFALKKVAVRGLRRHLVEAERERIASAIFDHLRLCGWSFSKAVPPVVESGPAHSPPDMDDEPPVG